MDHLAGNYRYILVDNEAGMEHLSRMNLRTIDHLLVVSDPSARGILTARRIAALTAPLAIETRRQWLIVNRAPEPAPAELTEKIRATVDEAGLPLAGILPASDELVRAELAGRSFLELEAGLPILERAYAAFDTIFSREA